MKTDWTNYNQLKKGEIIQSADHELSPESDCDGWNEVATFRVGKAANDPMCHGHMTYRRRISDGGNAGTGDSASRSETSLPSPFTK